MRTQYAAAALALASLQLAAPSASFAQVGGNDAAYGNGDARFQTVADHEYRGRDGRYYCKRSNGTTGLVAGGVGGGLAGHLLGGGTVGTLIGAGGGALLGRHLDKKHDEAQNRRNGC